MASRGQVRATAEIDKIPLRIGRDGLSIGKALNQLYLIVLAPSFEKLNGLSLSELSPRHRKLAFCNLASAFFDLFKIVRRKWPVKSEVVVKTGFECWSNRQLCGRKKLLYGLSHDVRAGMAIDFASLCAIKAKRLNRRIARQWSRQICRLSVDGGSKDIRAKSDPPSRERLSDALANRHIKTLSVLQADFWHKSLSISLYLYNGRSTTLPRDSAQAEASKKRKTSDIAVGYKNTKGTPTVLDGQMPSARW